MPTTTTLGDLNWINGWPVLVAVTYRKPIDPAFLKFLADVLNGRVGSFTKEREFIVVKANEGEEPAVLLTLDDWAMKNDDAINQAAVRHFKKHDATHVLISHRVPTDGRLSLLAVIDDDVDRCYGDLIPTALKELASQTKEAVNPIHYALQRLGARQLKNVKPRMGVVRFREAQEELALALVALTHWRNDKATRAREKNQADARRFLLNALTFIAEFQFERGCQCPKKDDIKHGWQHESDCPFYDPTDDEHG